MTTGTLTVSGLYIHGYMTVSYRRNVDGRIHKLLSSVNFLDIDMESFDDTELTSVPV